MSDVSPKPQGGRLEGGAHLINIGGINAQAKNKKETLELIASVIGTTLKEKRGLIVSRNRLWLYALAHNPDYSPHPWIRGKYNVWRESIV